MYVELVILFVSWNTVLIESEHRERERKSDTDWIKEE